MTLSLKKRGRPSKADLAAKAELIAASQRSDSEILEDLKERFQILEMLTHGAVHKNVRALTVTGAPGVGKTYTVERILHAAKNSVGIKFEIVRGALSAVNLYKLAWRMREPGSVVVLDDADSIFADEEALNVLKVLCDTSATRQVSWLKESPALLEEDIPKMFDFNGSMIFISNIDWQKFVDESRNKYSMHFEAIMSRSLYLDLRLHTRNELAIWIDYVATHANILKAEGLNSEQSKMVLSFLKSHRDNLRELSLRTLLKVSQLIKTHKDWERMARVLLLKRR